MINRVSISKVYSYSFDVAKSDLVVVVHGEGGGGTFLTVKLASYVYALFSRR